MPFRAALRFLAMLVVMIETLFGNLRMGVTTKTMAEIAAVMDCLKAKPRAPVCSVALGETTVHATIFLPSLELLIVRR
jgi:hypothetical protein